MCEKAILELYYYELENKKIEHSEEYDNVLDKINALSNKLETSLSEEQIRQLRDIQNLYSDLEAEVCEITYIAGFNTGMRIAVEALYKK